MKTLTVILLLISCVCFSQARPKNRPPHTDWFKHNKKKIETTASETVQLTCFAFTAYYIASGVGYPNQKPMSNLKRRQMILAGVGCMALTVSVSIPLKRYINNKYKY